MRSGAACDVCAVSLRVVAVLALLCCLPGAYSRRARVSGALASLRDQLFPQGSRHGRKRTPTEIDVLEAAITTVQAATSSSDDTIYASDDVDSASPTACSVGSAKRKQRQLRRKPSPACAHELLITDMDHRVRMTCAISGELVRAFQRPHRRDLVTMAFETAWAMHESAPRSPVRSSPHACSPSHDRKAGVLACTGQRDDMQLAAMERVALARRLLLLCAPRVLDVLEDMGVPTMAPLEEFTRISKLTWVVPECRHSFAEMRCLWFAPHLCGTPIDKLPVERLVMQLQRLVEGVAHVFATHSGIHTEKTPYRHAQDAIPHAVDRALVGGCCCQYGPTS